MTMAVVQESRKEKMGGEFVDVYRDRGETDVLIGPAGDSVDVRVVLPLDADVRDGHRLRFGSDIFDVSTVSPLESGLEAILKRNDFESSWAALESLGCEIGYGRMVPTGKDNAAEDYFDLWVGTYIKNIVAHLDVIRAGRNVGQLRDILERRFPVACVGAGPSLDRNVESLREFPGLIVCADKAYKMLRGRGIRPDFVISVDCHYDLVRDMVACRSNVADRLVLNTCSDPQVEQAWRGDIYWFNMAHPGAQFTDYILPALFPNMASIPNAGNVGNTSVIFAEMMGASEVLLVGQDFGYTGGRMHATRYEEGPAGWHPVEDDHAALLEKRHGKVTVEGILTYLPFPEIYAPTMYALRERRDIRITNCTEGGILTQLPQEALSDAVGRLLDAHGSDAADRARKILISKEEALPCPSNP